MSSVIWWLAGLVLSPILVEILTGALGPAGRVLIPVLLALGALRALLVLFIGSRAADHAVGRLAYDVISLPFRIIAAGLGFIVRAARHDP